MDTDTIIISKEAIKLAEKIELELENCGVGITELKQLNINAVLIEDLECNIKIKI